MPSEYREYFLKTKHCLNCGRELRHEMHAFNHFKRFHTKKERNRKPKYFLWKRKRWIGCNVYEYTGAKLMGVATVRGKGGYM